MQSSLFASAEPQRFMLQGGELTLYPQWVSERKACSLFRWLEKSLAWEQSVIQIYGRPVVIPRLNAWYGDPGCNYQYSGYRLPLNAWLDPLSEIRTRLHDELGVETNSVLANLYRDGQDSVGWHSDDEPELGQNPVIASLSLGGERRFSFRHRRDKTMPPLHLTLTPGSLLVMSGAVQHNWHHCLPKSRKVTAPRINLTYRKVVTV
ncbi:alpha-ketoglutarate-dependent dioxygenase AlkB [Aestuariicella hydrocarbonica]|uniref:Alpha-ketoglutarate-dependent dioxygenase AlkB n=1 Tax=Pseudomaricurvus hydrocarbonicus TaxID=1470433 RepID=A0A9E5MKD2_9GAMM|nr:alpha-ketoglutarate-dependent dioxygenase AlkB [Aestuariicella hydrocarbonica]NHO65227.1 alpha-ketoglutarate-dependent dioxygenase AlkB [Aestuariicella hydrocarbonica]